jgi:hypothetical protein
MGDSGYHAILDEMRELHISKSADYGDDADPLANVLAGEDFGVQNWIAVMIRANDKMKRIKTFAKKGTLANESIEDSLKDLAAYSMIALALLRREQRKETQNDR